MSKISWESPDCYARREGDCIHIGNDYIERVLSLKDDVFGTAALINKRTGKRWSIQAPHESRFVFASGAPRADIPCWRYKPGSPEAVNPSDDQGYRNGFYKPEFDDDQWRYVDCFTAVGESPRGDTESVWPGYGWFRAHFALTEELAGRPLYLTLGGYDNEDWHYYRVFVNGIEIGYREMSGRWREPEPFIVTPGDEAYASLRYPKQPGENLLAMQTGRLNKRLPTMVPGEVEHYKFGSRVVDQYITLGEPLVSVQKFTVRRWIVGGDRHFVWLRIMADSPLENLRLTFHYQVRSGEPWIRKKVEIHNTGGAERVLLDVDVETWGLDGDTDDGGFGFPLILDGQAFCALEHPAGLNQGLGRGVILRHFPGITLHPRQGTKSQTSLFGVGEKGGGVAAFHDYLRRSGKRRKEWIAIYDPLGLVDTCHPWEERFHFTEQVALDTVKMLEELQAKGIRFDAYIIDHGWEDHGSDLTWFKADEFPNGPDELIRGVHGLGMEFGLWFSGTYGSWSCGDYPPAQQSVVPRTSGAYDLCLASEPYRSILRNAMLHHIRKNHVKAMKIDMARFYCNSTGHSHLPGKYSVEAQIESVLETVRILHRECPELFIIWYWGFHSPFWLLYGSTLFDKKLLMEAAAVASSPHPCYRASTTHNLDQACRHARFIPLECQDSLGIWIGDVDWCNHMGKEDWREAWLLDLARGNMSIQLWGISPSGMTTTSRSPPNGSPSSERTAGSTPTPCRSSETHGKGKLTATQRVGTITRWLRSTTRVSPRRR